MRINPFAWTQRLVEELHARPPHSAAPWHGGLQASEDIAVSVVVLWDRRVIWVSRS
jgi:hypothetical protein